MDPADESPKIVQALVGAVHDRPWRGCAAPPVDVCVVTEYTRVQPFRAARSRQS
jgi:hypothetical protein